MPYSTWLYPAGTKVSPSAAAPKRTKEDSETLQRQREHNSRLEKDLGLEPVLPGASRPGHDHMQRRTCQEDHRASEGRSIDHAPDNLETCKSWSPWDYSYGEEDHYSQHVRGDYSRSTSLEINPITQESNSICSSCGQKRNFESQWESVVRNKKSAGACRGQCCGICFPVVEIVQKYLHRLKELCL